MQWAKFGRTIVAGLLFASAVSAQQIDTIGGTVAPTGSAGGVLSGTYPNPGFAAAPMFSGGLTVSSGGAAITGNSTVTGTLGVTNTSGGATTDVLNLINSSGIASTATRINLQPSAFSTRRAEIIASNNGSNVISLDFLLSNGASPASVLTLSGAGNGAATVTGTLGVSSSILIYNATAIPAGGTTGSGYVFSSTSNFGVFFGSGAPTLSAAKGSLYLRSDGSGVNDRMYVNTNGSTTWTAVVTAG